MAEDRKFEFNPALRQFVNRVSGEAIPHDEPVIIFRARDVHALPVLELYKVLVDHPHHQRVVEECIEEFASFKSNNPHRMKEPGITEHFTLLGDREDLHEGRRRESPLEDRVDALEHRDDTLERKMNKVMADIDTLTSILQGIADDATTLTADFKDLEAELQAAQEAAANNQPIDLTNAILLARSAQAALDSMVQMAGEAPTSAGEPAPTDTTGEAATDTAGEPAGDTTGEAATDTTGEAATDTTGEATTDTTGEAATDTTGEGAGDNTEETA